MRALVAILIIILLGAAAYASETITYQYDTRGRLIQVSHSGSVNNNIVTNYVYDKADNRQSKTAGEPRPQGRSEAEDSFVLIWNPAD